MDLRDKNGCNDGGPMGEDGETFLLSKRTKIQTPRKNHSVPLIRTEESEGIQCENIQDGQGIGKQSTVRYGNRGININQEFG